MIATAAVNCESFAWGHEGSVKIHTHKSGQTFIRELKVFQNESTHPIQYGQSKRDPHLNYIKLHLRVGHAASKFTT